MTIRTKEEIVKGMDDVTFLTKCQLSFKFFVENAMGLTTYGGVHKYQEEWVNEIEKNKVTVIEAPPNSSKTEIAGVAYALWYILNHPKTKVLLVAKASHQAKSNLMNRIKRYIEENVVLKELWAPEKKESIWNNTQIELKERSTITVVPYSINIRSYRGDIIICDEVDSYEDSDIYFSEVTTRLNPGGKMVLISTRQGPERLIGKLKAKQPRGYKFVKTTAIVDGAGNPKKRPYNKGKSYWPERFPLDDLLSKIDELGESIFELNYMCNPNIEGDDAIFSTKSFVECYDPTVGFSKEVNKDAQYFIGADFAISKGPKADFDAFVVLEKYNDQTTIKWMEKHKGWSRPAKVRRLKELYDQYHSDKTTKIIADESNMGAMVISDLRSHGATVIPQKFHYAARRTLLLTLANVVEGQALIVPRHPKDHKAIDLTDELLKQMIGFRRRVSNATGSESVESKANHDDLCVSLAMAAQEASKMKGMPSLGLSAR